jgi:hypothetical protein
MLWGAILGFLRGPLDRILSTIDRKVDNDTERERIKTGPSRATSTHRRRC